MKKKKKTWQTCIRISEQRKQLYLPDREVFCAVAGTLSLEKKFL